MSKGSGKGMLGKLVNELFLKDKGEEGADQNFNNARRGKAAAMAFGSAGIEYLIGMACDSIFSDDLQKEKYKELIGSCMYLPWDRGLKVAMALALPYGKRKEGDGYMTVGEVLEKSVYGGPVMKVVSEMERKGG
jgi:hypothetical protein